MATATLSPSGFIRQQALQIKARQILQSRTKALEDDWSSCLRTLFPANLTDPRTGAFVPFATYQTAFWDWVWSIQKGVSPRPFVGIWPRGGGKSSSCEMACVLLGGRMARRYCLYVGETQEQADDHVSNVGSLLESNQIDTHYPAMGRPLVGKFGNPKGWRRNRLRASSGFTIDALGLDTAARGIKLEENRPDLMIFDDLDGELDSPLTTTKKIKTLTTKLLPAGSKDVAVVMIQNLVHKTSIFSKLAGVDQEETADFLNDRIVSGPYPALDGFAYEQQSINPETGRPRWIIVGGTPTWEWLDVAACQVFIDTWGLSAFLTECQHDVEDTGGGMFDHLIYTHCTWDEVPELIRVTVAVDPAVTDTDNSDSYGIQADGLASDGTIYRLFSWEERTSPDDAMTRAILKAIELKAYKVVVETDQGGDTWKSVYLSIWEKMVKDGTVPKRTIMPRFAASTAGSGHGPKAHRAAQQLADYERGMFVHVLGTHERLEKALFRFPLHKPFDLVDACLVADTMIQTESGEKRIADVQVGEKVWTRAGLKKVLKSGVTIQNANCIRVDFDNGQFLIGTPSHPVWTENRGWVTMDSLYWSDIIVIWKNQELQGKSSNGVAPGGFATLIQKFGTIASTTQPWISRWGKKGYFTVQSTWQHMDQFLRAMIFTTTTLIHSTMTPETSWRLPALNTERLIMEESLVPLNWNTSPRSDRLPLPGTEAMRGERGIKNTRKTLFSRMLPTAQFLVSNAARSSQLVIAARSSFARRLAGMLGTRNTPGEKWSRSSVLGANDPSKAGLVDPPMNAVPAHVLQIYGHSAASVYNLTVEDQPEFFANGVLVHNSYWSFSDLRHGLKVPTNVHALGIAKISMWKGR